MNFKTCPVPVYGNVDFRGSCPTESIEQISFFNWLRREQLDPWSRLALHPRNEQQLRGGQHQALARHKAEGMTTGASDIIIPGPMTFVCEMKRRDHTRSKWQEGQLEYLTSARDAGAFACVALGYEAAKEAFAEWQKKVQTLGGQASS